MTFTKKRKKTIIFKNNIKIHLYQIKNSNLTNDISQNHDKQNKQTKNVLQNHIYKGRNAKKIK